MQRFFGVAQDINGNAIPAATVTVNLAGTGTAATLFSDNAFTPLVNPFTSNTDGTYQYYVRNGRYDTVITKTNFTFTNSETTDVLLDDDFSVTSPAAITADQNDYAPTNGVNTAIWRINSDASRSITGIAAPTANAGQRILTLINNGSFNITLVNASVSSGVNNRFTCAAARDYVLFPAESILLIYDTSSSTWRVGTYQSVRVLDQTGTGATVSTNAETTVYTFSVLGGTLGTSTRRLRVTHRAKITNTTGGNATAIVRLKYGGTTMASQGAMIMDNGLTNVSALTNAEIATIAASSEEATMWVTSDQGVSTVIPDPVRGTAAIDQTVAQSVSITVQLSASSALLTYTPTYTILEWLP